MPIIISPTSDHDMHRVCASYPKLTAMIPVSQPGREVLSNVNRLVTDRTLGLMQ